MESLNGTLQRPAPVLPDKEFSLKFRQALVKFNPLSYNRALLCILKRASVSDTRVEKSLLWLTRSCFIVRLSTWVSTFLSACLQSCLFIRLSTVLSACLQSCLLVYSPVCLSTVLSAWVYSPVCLSTVLSACIYSPVCLSKVLPVYPLVYSPACLSACLSLFVFSSVRLKSSLNLKCLSFNQPKWGKYLHEKRLRVTVYSKKAVKNGSKNICTVLCYTC